MHNLQERIPNTMEFEKTLPSHSVEKKTYCCSTCQQNFTRIDKFNVHLQKCEVTSLNSNESLAHII